MQSTKYHCCGTVYYAVQGGSNLGSVDEILSLSPFHFPVVLFVIQGGSNV